MTLRALALAALALAGCDDAPGSNSAPATPPHRPFTDAFAASGVRADVSPRWPFPEMGPINAASLIDCDADGRPDAYVTSWSSPGRLWRNVSTPGQIRFEEIPGPDTGAQTPGAASVGDLDNDGLQDLVISLGVEEYLRSQRDEPAPYRQEVRVYRNMGACRFEDVSAAWGFTPWSAPQGSMPTGVDLADVNLDGRLDMVTRSVLDPDALVRMYLSRPDGTWVESMREIFGDTPGCNWANFFTDIDDNGLADLFILFDQHLGPPARFLRRTSATAQRPFVEESFDPRYFAPEYNPAALMGAAVADVDGDAKLDLYLLDLGPQHLYTHRSGRRDVAVEAGVAIPQLMPSKAPTVAFGVSFADYDNDTWPDLFVAVGVTDGFYTPPTAVLLHNRGNGTFEDTSALLRQPETFTSFWVGGSDLDRDGWVDYWLGGFAGAPRILQNATNGYRSMAVRLRGRTSNAEGVGSKVTVRVGARTLVQEMQSGGTGWGYGEHRLMFGLGRAARADGVEVRWPTGYVQRVGPVAAGAEVVITEPELIRVAPQVLAVGGDVQVTVRPAGPDGAALGPGRRVVVTMDPGEVSLPVTDDGAGNYVATARGVTAGVHRFSVRIDGTALFAHPQVIAR